MDGASLVWGWVSLEAPVCLLSVSTFCANGLKIAGIREQASSSGMHSIIPSSLLSLSKQLEIYRIPIVASKNKPNLLQHFNTPNNNFNMSAYYNTAYSTQPAYKRSKSVKSDHEVTLNGPVEVAGYVKSGSSINLNGDVIIREKLDAYGSIGLNGSIRCE